MSDKREVLIQVKDLKKYFGNNKVLDGITTDIRKGEVVAIIATFRFRKIYFFAVSQSA